MQSEIAPESTRALPTLPDAFPASSEASSRFAASTPRHTMNWVPNAPSRTANCHPLTHYHPNGCSILDGCWRGSWPLSRTTNPMASKRIALDPPTVEAIARRVVELLERRGLQRRELVDAAELARRFGIERSWVYSHAIELGAIKLGDGSKPRLRFDPEIAARVLRVVGEGSAADPPARSGERAGQPQRDRGSEVRLLPIRGRGENGPPPAA